MLLQKLRELQVYINQEDVAIKTVEGYNYFYSESNDMDCTYASKCRMIFERDMLDEVRTFIHQINELLKIYDKE